MKVLYISHVKESSGWGTSAENQILALDAVGVDVVCRNVTLTRDRDNVHPKILELEQKDSRECDICIQHVLPHHLIGSDMFKRNIAFLEAESTSLSKIAWIEHLKLVNEVWVPNQDLCKSLRDDDGLQLPIHIVHHPCNYDRYTKKYPEITIPQLENKFVFYYIGDLNDRKNIDSIVTCFHSEFDKSEPVGLLLKVKKFGKSPEETRQIMDAKLSQIKNTLRMYPNIQDYARDLVIAEDVSDENICSIHQYCDCFVCPSHGEAWSIPTFDAMAFGNSPIASDYGGPAEFIPLDPLRLPAEECGTLVGGSYSVCKCSDAAFPDIFTGREYWFQPCEMEIRETMREKYETYKQDPLAAKRGWKLSGLKQAKKFSYEAIGNKMKEILSESPNTTVH